MSPDLRTLALAALLLPASSAAAQEPADTAAASTELRGRVLLMDEPVDTATVILHRVAPDTAGPIDSVRVTSEGTFTLRLPTAPDPEARSEVYFASVRRGGVLYFGNAVTEAPHPDSTYRIRVYENREAGPDEPALSVAHRNLFVEPGEEAWRVTDLLEVRNAGERTLVAPAGGGATFRYPLPPGAADLEVGEQDLAPGALTLDDGDLVLATPLPPGERLYVVRYSLPPPPLRIPLPGRTEVVELLIEEPAPPLRIEALEQAEPVEIQPGSTYRRFTGSDIGPAEILVEVAEEEPGGVPPRVLGAALALLLGVAGLIAYYRPFRAGRPAPTTDRREILIALAELDEAHDARERPSPAEERAYRLRRRELLERLDEASAPPTSGPAGG